MDKKAGGMSKLQDYDILNKLGQGSFGIVYKVKRKTDQKIYVLKQIDISRMSTAQKKEAVHEATILSKINSPYIVKFYDSFTDKNQINIIMEYCENGDLGIFLKRQMGKQLTENTIWKFFVEMCLGMHYLHSNKILHRDIKTINMFLNKGDKIKIGDLGVAKMLNQTANFAHTVVGTPYYLSPELCEEKPYNHKSDVWSLGCVLYELCTLKHPFEANNQGALILKIVRGKYNPISAQYSKDLSKMVDFLLSRDYKKRPSIQEILDTPIMQDKSAYFGFTVQKPDQLLVLPQGNKQVVVSQNQNSQQNQPERGSSNQQKGSAMPQEQIKKINDAAAALRQNNIKPLGGGAAPSKELISQRDKQYQQNLIDAQKQKEKQRIQDQQQQIQVNGGRPAAIQNKPTQVQSNIPSSYMDPVKRQVQSNLLNNNQFDQKEYERKQQQNLIQLQKQQQQQQNRPSSNQNQLRSNVKEIPQNNNKPQIQEKQPIVSTQNLNQQYIQQQQQLKGIPQNQRVKSGAPSQLSRQAQMAQKQGQRIIKQGDSDKQPIFKPDVKALRPQQSDQQLISKQQQSNPLISGNQKPTSNSGKNYQQEINDVMNLPNDLNKKNQNAGGHQLKSNQDLIAEAQRKRDALNRVNNKFQGAGNSGSDYKNLIGADISGKAASELHDLKLMVPNGKYETPSSHHSREPSTQQQSDNNNFNDSDSNIGQKQLDDDEFAELLNGCGGGSGDFVQPTWNINGVETGMRDTQFVPFYNEEDNEDEDFKVHHDRDASPYQKHGKKGKNKMGTIREDLDEEDRKSNGSDTAYFSPENDVNDRDDFDSDEEHLYKERVRQLGFMSDDADEDNQPYDIEDQQRKEKEEFGDSEEEDNQQQEDIEEEQAQMSMTMQDRRRKDIEKQLKDLKRRQNELAFKIDQKVKEGVDITKNAGLFEQCFKIFCDKAQKSDELSDNDYSEINHFISRNVGEQASLQLTATLFQLYFFKEELPSIQDTLRELQSEHDQLCS